MHAVLVTGGCGFIGSNFIHYLLEAEPEATVVNFDALTYAGNLANLADLAGHPRYRFVHGDITDRAAVRPAVRGVSAIIHFAAESHVDRSIHDSGPFVRTNILGTQILLDAAREAGLAKYVQVSTDEVYGSLGSVRGLHGSDAAGAEQPICSQQGRCRSAGAQLCSYVRAARRHHALLQQLRALPVPREADPAVHQQPDARRAGAGLRRRLAGARLDSRARPRGGHPPGLARWASRRGLQLRRPLRTHQPGPDARPARHPGQAALAHQLRQGPPRARSPLRHRLHQGRTRAGLAARACLSSKGCAKRCAGTRTITRGSPPSAAAST